jgi:TPR repeat protein
MKRALGIVLVGACLLGACVPYTSIPMAALMSYDSVGKRKRLKERAEEGDVYAMYDLAESYRKHPYEGITNKEKAAYWYCKAARGGYGKAQYELALLYEGQGAEEVELEPDPARSYMWYHLAARRMHPEAILAVQRLRPGMSDKEKAYAEMLLTEWKTVPCGPDEKAKPLPEAKKKKGKKSEKKASSPSKSAE